jgi:phosphopantothenoylcysteine decarboxylase/phosphopantothenate--cysteine ligase
MTKATSLIFGKTIVLGVTGGIAAYKAADLASKLTAAGAKVYTVMTENACKLILPKTFEALTGLPVFTTMWTEPQEFKIKHVDLAVSADIVVVAPATADVIAKLATGICDDVLTTTLCAAWKKPTLIAPAMNDNMWTNPIVQKNVKALAEMGYQFIGPEKGRLACGTEGVVGRMSEPADIFTRLEEMTKQSPERK